MAKLGFGKYADLDITLVPEDYLVWLISNSQEKIKLYQRELDRRAAVEDASGTWMERLVKAGYRELAKRHHPDTGGKADDFKAVQAAFEALSQHVKPPPDPF